MDKILIVEDEQKILLILDKIVRSAGYDTVLASDGEHGLRLAREHIPDLVLTDIFMPKLNGLDLCKKLKNDRKTANIGIIVITASNESPDLLKIFQYGANAWIKKPFLRAEVLQSIEQVKIELSLIKRRQILGDWIELELSSTIAILQSVNLFIENLMSHTAISTKDCRELGFAINEMLLNGMEHGNQFNLQKRVRISYVLFKEKLIIKIEDEGQGFIPDHIPDPLDRPQEVAEMREKEGKRPGGYGLAVTRQYVDKVEYSDQGNTLLLTKMITDSSLSAKKQS